MPQSRDAESLYGGIGAEHHALEAQRQLATFGQISPALQNILQSPSIRGGVAMANPGLLSAPVAAQGAPAPAEPDPLGTVDRFAAQRAAARANFQPRQFNFGSLMDPNALQQMLAPMLQRTQRGQGAFAGFGGYGPGAGNPIGAQQPARLPQQQPYLSRLHSQIGRR